MMAANLKPAAVVAATSSSSSSSSNLNENVDADYSNINETSSDYPNDYKRRPDYVSETKSVQLTYPCGTQPQHWLIEEAERQRRAKQLNQVRMSAQYADSQQKQRLRRSVPNLLTELNNCTQQQQQQQNPVNYVYQQNSYMNPSVSSSAMSRTYQQKPKKTCSTQQNTRQLSYSQMRNTTHSTSQPTRSIFSSSKPPNPRVLSSSQNDLKNAIKIHHHHHQQQPQQTKQISSASIIVSPPSSTGSSCPIISLNQKCSSCSQMLGQGSAMFIEKLGLAFHLKCFRCSVCNVPLGNLSIESLFFDLFDFAQSNKP